LVRFAVIDGLLCSLTVAFSVYAGIRLWDIRPGAVRTAKRFLWCIVGYHAVLLFLPFLAGLPKIATGAMIVSAVTELMGALVYVGLWTSYLNRSQRVRATYDS